MLVSLIIPVYNVEKYIRRCLASVANQTYKNLEVIVVNDGSPDQSQVIIDEFCEKYKFIHSYITENNGLGGARNYGLTKAKGEYVCFLDSDDYVSEVFVEKLVKKAVEDNSDIVACNNYDVFEESGHKEESKAKVENNPVVFWEHPEIIFNRMSAWGKLYRTSLFQNLVYEPRAWYEDMRLTPKLYALANQISYVEEPLVYYMIREGSIMTSANVKRNLEIIDAFEDLRQYFIKKGTYSKIQHELEFLMLDHILVATMTRIIMQKDEHKNEVIQKLRDYVFSYSDITGNPYLKTMSKNRKIIYTCNRHKWYFITKLIFKIK